MDLSKLLQGGSQLVQGAENAVGNFFHPTPPPPPQPMPMQQPAPQPQPNFFDKLSNVLNGFAQTAGPMASDFASSIAKDNAFTELGQGFQGIGNYIHNFIGQPAQQTVQNFSQGQIVPGLLSGLQTVGGVVGPEINMVSGALSGGLTALRQGKSPQDIAAATLQGTQTPGSISQGLGITNPLLATATDLFLTRRPSNIIEDPLMLNAAKNLLGGMYPNAKATVPLAKGWQKALEHEDGIMDVFNRYNKTFGPMAGDNPVYDTSVPEDAEYIWHQIYGQNKQAPLNIHQTMGELIQALEGAKTQDMMQQSGIKLGFVGTPQITNDLHDALAGAETPDDEAEIIKEFTDNAIRDQQGNSLKATRAALNQEINATVGTSGAYKTDYAMRKTLLDSPDVGPRLNALENSVARIDEELNKPQQNVSSINLGGGDKGLDPQDVQQFGKDLVSPEGQAEKVEEYQKAAQNQPIHDGLGQAVANETGARYIANYKNPDTFEEKVVSKRADGRDYNPDDINDTYRSRLVYPDKGTLYQGVDIFKQRAEQIGLKVAKESDFFQHPEDGYQGYHIDVQFPNGQHEEVQFHTEKSLAASLATHDFHAQYGDGEMPEQAEKLKSKLNHEIMDATNPQAQAITDNLMAKNEPANQEAQMKAEQTIQGTPPPSPLDNVQPATPGYSTGQAAADPKYVAEQARLARFSSMQQVQFRAGQLADEANAVLRGKDNDLFRAAVEHPDQLETLVQQASNPQKFIDLAQKYSAFTDYVFSRAQQSGVDFNFTKDYFTHIIDLSTPEKQQAFEDFLAKNANNFRSGFTKQRVFDTIDQLRAAGFELKNKNVSQDIVDYARSMSKQIGASSFNQRINELRPSGAVAMKDNGTVPYNYQGQLFRQSNVPGNAGTFIDPEIQKYMGHYDPSALNDNPYFKAFDTINKFKKEGTLAGGIFHAWRETFNYMGTSLASGKLPNLLAGARMFVDPSFARTQFDQFINSGVVDDASKMGIQLSNASPIGDETGDILSMISSKDPIKKATFERLINYYMLDTVSKLPQDLRTPQMGKQIMGMYSGVNKEVAGSNKTVSAVLRSILLAPQFNIGKLLNVKAALSPSLAPEANFARAAILGTVVATAVEYEIANYAFNHKLDTNLQSVLMNGVLHPTVSLPYQSPTGKKLQADMPGTDVSDLYKTGIGSLLQGNPNQALTDLNHSLTSRSGSLLSMINQLRTGQDYYGNPLTPLSFAESNSPIPVSQILKTVTPGSKGVPTQDAKTAVLNTLGFRVHTDPNDPSVKYAQTQQQLISQQPKTIQDAYANLQDLKKMDPNDPMRKADEALQFKLYPQLFSIAQELEYASANGDDTQVDPLYRHGNEQAAQKLLTYNSLPPGSAEAKQYLKNNADVSQMETQRSQFFQQHPIQTTGVNQFTFTPPPAPSPYVLQQMAAKNWNDPQVQQYMQQHLAYENGQRQQWGLDPIDSYGNILGSKNYGVTFGSGGSGLLPSGVRRSLMRNVRYSSKQGTGEIGELLEKARSTRTPVKLPQLRAYGTKAARISLAPKKGNKKLQSLRLA